MLRKASLLLIAVFVGFPAGALEYPLQAGSQLIFESTTTPTNSFPQRQRYELWLLDEREPGKFEAVWAVFANIGTPQELLAGAIPLFVRKDGSKEFVMERFATFPLQEQVESFLPTLPESYRVNVWKGPAMVTGWYLSYQVLGQTGDFVHCSFAQYGLNNLDQVMGSITSGQVFFDANLNWLRKLEFTTRQKTVQGEAIVATAEVALTGIYSRDENWKAKVRDEAARFFTVLRGQDEEILKASENIGAATFEAGPLFALWQGYLAESETSRFGPLARTQFAVVRSSVKFLQDDWSRRRQILGRQSPAWTLNDTRGGAHNLGAYAGKPVLLVFWSRAHWWSLLALRDIPALAETYGSRGLVILPVNLDSTDDEANSALDRMGLQLSTLRSTDPALLQSYGVHFGALPASILLDSQGVVRDIRYGWNKQVTDQLKQRIEAVF